MFERLAKKIDGITLKMKLGTKQRQLQSTLEKLKLELTKEEEQALVLTGVASEYEDQGNYESELHQIVSQRGPGEWIRLAQLATSAEAKISEARERSARE
jgi:hypothetical protein